MAKEHSTRTSSSDGVLATAVSGGSIVDLNFVSATTSREMAFKRGEGSFVDVDPASQDQFDAAQASRTTSSSRLTHVGPCQRPTESQSNRERTLSDLISPATALLQQNVHRELICAVCLFRSRTTTKRTRLHKHVAHFEGHHADPAEWLSPTVVVATETSAWQNAPRCKKNY